MPRKETSSLEQIVAKSSLFTSTETDAMSKIADQLLEFKYYAWHQNQAFLAYLLEMAETETRNVLSGLRKPKS